MDQDRRTPPPPPLPRTGSTPHAGATSSGSSVRASPSSAMLGLSSSPASPHRRFSPSLYPPPAPSPGRLASGSGSGSASRFGQIPPSSPATAPGGRQRSTHALPSPFHSELASIRRMGASLFGDLDDARPTNHRGASATPQAAIHGQQPQPQQQAWPSPMPTMSRDSRLRTPPPSGIFSQSQVAPSVSRQQQPPSPGGMPPLSGNRFAGFPGSAFWSQPRRQVQSSSPGVPPPPASQQQQQTTTYHPDPSPSSTDLAPLPTGSGSIFSSGFAAPPASKSSFTDLAPLPAEIESSSWSSAARLAPDTASHTVTMYSPAQSSSDTELQPLPPSLQMPSPDQTPSWSWQWQSSGNGSSSTCSEFEAPILDVPVGPRVQIKEEPVDLDFPCIQMQPELISLDDDDDDDVITALLQSFKSSTEPAPSLLEDSLQLGGSGSVLVIDEGIGQSWDIARQNLQFPLMPSPTDRLELNSSHGPSVWSTGGDTSGQGWAGMPALAGMFDQMSIAGGTAMSIGQGWPAMPAAAGQYGMLLDNSGSPWRAVPSCASTLDQMNIIGGGSMSTGQGWPETPAAAVEAGVFHNSGGGSSPWPAMPSCGSIMLDQMNIGGGNMMSMSQGWPETPASATAVEAGVFDNSGSNSSPWPAMPSCGNNMFDQMNIGGGSMSMGQGWPETPPEAASNYSMFDFDNTGGSSSNAWASKPSNFSSSSMENSTPVPKLILGGMEKPRLPRRQPSLAALASSMSPKGSCGDLFSVAEIQTINKDKRLKEIVNTDPRRVKRILSNRASAANLRARRNALDLS